MKFAAKYLKLNQLPKVGFRIISKVFLKKKVREDKVKMEWHH